MVRLSLLAMISALTLVVTAQASAQRLKPTSVDFDRIQLAARSALGKLGLVDARSCDRDDLNCLNRAASAESASFARAASIQRSVAKKLSGGKCRTAILNRAAAYSKHASDVKKALAEWTDRNYVDAADSYYAPWNPGAQKDGLFLKYC